MCCIKILQVKTIIYLEELFMQNLRHYILVDVTLQEENEISRLKQCTKLKFFTGAIKRSIFSFFTTHYVTSPSEMLT